MDRNITPDGEATLTQKWGLEGLSTHHWALFQELGLTHEEANIFVFLLQLKSATVAELAIALKQVQKLTPSTISAGRSPTKQRTNLYKYLNQLVLKGFAFTESKGVSKRFFPLDFEILIDSIVAQKRRALDRLIQQAQEVTKELNGLTAGPNLNFSFQSNPTSEYISRMIPDTWSLKETLYMQSRPPGQSYSVEFITPRKRDANEAGLTVVEFRYPEHAIECYQQTWGYLVEEMQGALNALKGKFITAIKEFSWDVTDYIFRDRSLPVVRFHVKLHLGISGESFIFCAISKEHPTHILAFWATHPDDFALLVGNFLDSFAILHTTPYRFG